MLGISCPAKSEVTAPPTAVVAQLFVYLDERNMFRKNTAEAHQAAAAPQIDTLPALCVQQEYGDGEGHVYLNVSGGMQAKVGHGEEEERGM